MPPRRVAAIPSSGDGHANLAPQVDQFVKDLMKKENLPGMSVAITQGGRLILAKGYGYANVQTKALLKENARLRIGSVTKAVVTGPAGFQLMKAKGINPATTTLYGTNGLFGTTYDSDIEIGVKRYTPIVALAIGPQDHVYAWYSNGRFSSGTTSDLDKYSTPKSYSLAPGKKPVDIRGIAIANTHPEIAAFVYYDDGTRSSGPPEDLDRYGVSQNSVALPRGKSMLHVVGIAMAKSNNHVYVWYEDGTVSAGSTTNFESYSKPKPFTVPHQASPFMGFTPYTIRGVSIASNDHVYTWFSNGQVSSGRSTKLDHYKSPYAYTMPLRRTGGPDDWQQWYRKITVQNLLDHRAGFTRSGDEDGASAMFLASPNHPLTYHMVHRHFLRTRKLLYEPDTAGAYSNHGFGLWTLLIEQMSGKSYRSYVQDDYLKPLGLNDDVIPETTKPDARNARPHNYDKDNKPVPIDLEEADLGLAAGGFIASAQDLARLMAHLEARYSSSELDDMGWGKTSKGKFEHSGGRDGGVAYVTMFPQGYKSKDNVDLSRVHIALATNIGTETNLLESLADKIALAVPAANVPISYNLWTFKVAIPTGGNLKTDK